MQELQRWALRQDLPLEHGAGQAMQVVPLMLDLQGPSLRGRSQMQDSERTDSRKRWQRR